MCGIAGVLQPGSEIGRERLHASIERLQCRGPDGQGVWTSGPFGFGHTRLAVIDRAHGKQPMMSPDGRLAVVFNGEIYNHRQLRRDLAAEGLHARTRCDTEVLLLLYSQMGTRMVDRLDGMFAFALADLASQTLFLARDRFGKKPLSFHRSESNVAFASTADALTSLLEVKPLLDVQSIAEYMALQYVPSPRSPWQKVQKLPPAHTAVFDSTGGVHVERYWRPKVPCAARIHTPKRGEIRSRLRTAVEKRLESEVPLGVFLSGGIDSSAIVAELAELKIPTTTYSVGFEEAAFDESSYAALVASHFGMDHRQLRVQDDVQDLFSGLVRAYDEPFADSSALATLGVARAASSHISVVLTGDGGDELFGGYERYLSFLRLSRLVDSMGSVSRVAASIAGRAAYRLGLRRAGKLRSPWESYVDGLFHFHPSELAEVLQPDVAALVDESCVVDRLGALWNETGRSARDLPWVDMATYLPDDLLTKVDRATMSVGLEARSPFLDQSLADFASDIPSSALYARRSGKEILRLEYQGVLPDQVVHRPKQGFGVPIAAWLREQLRGRVDELLLVKTGPIHDLVRPEVSSSLVRQLRHGDDRPARRVWNLLVLAGWLAER